MIDLSYLDIAGGEVAGDAYAGGEEEEGKARSVTVVVQCSELWCHNRR